MIRQNRKPGRRQDPWADKTYVESRKIDLLRRLDEAEQEAQFDNAIRQAHKRDTALLCNHLRSQAPLTDEQREALADLIRRRLQHKPKGRPKGVSRQPAAQAERLVVDLVRKELKRLHSRYGKPLPKRTRTKALDEILNRLSGDGYFYGLRINVQNINEMLRRGERRSRTIKPPHPAKIGIVRDDPRR
jgi:hypothetical protein